MPVEKVIRVLIAESFDADFFSEVADQQSGLFFYADGNIPVDVPPGMHVVYRPDISGSNLPLSDFLSGYDAVMVRPMEITAEDFKAADRLKLVVRGGAGINSINLDAAKSCGVVVENTPGQNSISTAEFSFALLMELVANRQVLRVHEDILADREELAEFYVGTELYQMKLAVIGVGNIGQSMARMARGFGMEVKGYSRSFTDERAQELGIGRAESLEEALSWAEIISLHAPLSEQTQHMIDAAACDVMRPGSWIINTARPGLMDPVAVRSALESGKLAGVAIDGDRMVPGESDEGTIEPYVHMAREFPDWRILTTHHVADNTRRAQRNIAEQCLAQIQAFFYEGKEINRVA